MRNGVLIALGKPTPQGRTHCLEFRLEVPERAVTILLVVLFALGLLAQLYGTPIRAHFAEKECREYYFDGLRDRNEPFACSIIYGVSKGVKQRITVDLSDAKRFAPQAILIQALKLPRPSDFNQFHGQGEEEWQDQGL